MFGFVTPQPSWLAKKGIHGQITGVSIMMIYMFANKWSPGPRWYILEFMLEECLKGQEIVMNCVAEVISIYLIPGYIVKPVKTRLIGHFCRKTISYNNE